MQHPSVVTIIELFGLLLYQILDWLIGAHLPFLMINRVCISRLIPSFRVPSDSSAHQSFEVHMAHQPVLASHVCIREFSPI